MSRFWSLGMAAAFLVAGGLAQAADESVEDLRLELDELKRNYQDRIEALERQLEDVEADDAAGAAAVGAAAAGPEAGSSEPVTSGTAFNPQISVILDGFYYDDDIGGEGAGLAGEAVTAVGGGGHGHGEEEGHGHGGAERGFNLRQAELVFSGTVDPYFDANARIVVESEGDVELEEAWFQTRALPAGLKLKAGKFKSDIGYINRQHPHQWDFTDQNLAYLNLLGFEGVTDLGAQLNWVPRLPIFTQFGFELLQGEREELFGSVVEDDAEREELGLGDPRQPRLITAYAKVAPNVGLNSALQLGLSYLRAADSQQVGELEAGGGEVEAGLEGDSDMWIVDLVYRYDGSGSYGRGDIKVQTEYLYQENDFTVTGVGDPAGDPLVGSSVSQKSDGWYLQGVYGFLPRWQVGLRYDVVGPTNKISNGESVSFDDSSRWTAAVTWTPTEFSRFRLQLARADILNRDEETEELVRNEFDSVYLQYIISLGSHGAHYF